MARAAAALNQALPETGRRHKRERQHARKFHCAVTVTPVVRTLGSVMLARTSLPPRRLTSKVMIGLLVSGSPVLGLFSPPCHVKLDSKFHVVPPSLDDSIAIVS